MFVFSTNQSVYWNKYFDKLNCIAINRLAISKFKQLKTILYMEENAPEHAKQIKTMKFKEWSRSKLSVLMVNYSGSLMRSSS